MLDAAKKSVSDAGPASIKGGFGHRQVERVEKEVVVGRITKINARVGIGKLIIKVRVIRYVSRSADNTGSAHGLTPSVRCRRSRSASRLVSFIVSRSCMMVAFDTARAST